MCVCVGHRVYVCLLDIVHLSVCECRYLCLCVVFISWCVSARVQIIRQSKGAFHVECS